jgi:DNA-binding transcriptional LysR family regulator
MDPRRLMVLAEIAEHRSFSRAAVALNLTQPSLSRQVATLERECGMRLFDRLPTGVRTTVAGEALIRRGQAITAQVVAADHDVARLAHLQAGQLRIVAFPSAAATLALDALVALRATHPDLLISVEERDSPLPELRAGRADIAITFSPDSEPADDLLDTALLLEESMLLAVACDDPRATSDPIPLNDLRDDLWIIGTDRRARDLILAPCLEAGFTPRVAARLDNQPAIQAAVAAGIGVTLIPTLAARAVRTDLVLKQLAPPTPTCQLHTHTWAGPPDSAIRAGLAALRVAAAEHADGTPCTRVTPNRPPADRC